jgi:SPX domain protein involved in polyphosphate accumulation
MRYEIKYSIHEDAYFWLVDRIMSHPALFKEIFHERQINNLYLDSIELDSYQANLRGSPTREKTRIRWYGDLFQTINKPALEIKRRFGLVGDKLVYPLNPFEISNGYCWQAIVESQQTSNNLGEPEQLVIDDRLSSQVPSVVNSYYRRYYLSSNGKFRITIDSEIQYFVTKTGWINPFSIREQQIIMELKYNQEYAKEAPNMSNYFPFRIARNSKYVKGINATALNEIPQ